MDGKQKERKELKMRQNESNLHQNESAGFKCGNPVKCRTCRFAHGDSPFENSPEKSYCMIYSRESGEQKPPDVYYDGGDCEYYDEFKG